ncbi:MAG: hypothetical protein ACTHM6_06180 [Tepidisphaeraceae bacterium]
MFRAEAQPHSTERNIAGKRFVLLFDTSHVAGRRRNGTRKIMFDNGFDFFAPGLPFIGGADRPAGGVDERVGQRILLWKMSCIGKLAQHRLSFSHLADCYGNRHRKPSEPMACRR